MCTCVCVGLVLSFLWVAAAFGKTKVFYFLWFLSKSQPGKTLKPGLPGANQRLSLFGISGNTGQDLSTEG